MDANLRFLAYLMLIINLVGFVTVGIDKYKSRRSLWRIPERVLFGIAIVGGSVGVYCGIFLFRHKTRHWYFVYGIPLIFAFQLWLCYLVIN